jgi:hypothetical protein
VVAYTVLPTYGRNVNTSLIGALSGDPQAAEKARIITDEQYVPLNLVCMLRVWDPRLPGRSGEPGKLVEHKDETIDNRVTQHPDDYQLEKVALEISINTGAYSDLIKAGLRGQEAITVRAAVILNAEQTRNPITEQSKLFQLVTELELGWQTASLSPRVNAILGSGQPILDKSRFNQLVKNGRLALT